MFDYVDSNILGGLCIASQNIADNDNNKLTIYQVVMFVHYIHIL